MLIEELRPKTLNEVIGQELTIRILKGFIKRKMIPHLLFHGKAGTGKTTVALAFAREYYGEKWQDYFLEMNASDERKLSDVRTKIKDITKLSLLDEPFKILFLDEVDSMDRLGQNALRRIMEQYADRTIFILSCNYKNKLIEPLQNRCVDFYFSPLKEAEMKHYIKDVCSKHDMTIEDDAISLLSLISQGSVRTVLSTLEKLIATNIKTVTKDYIETYTNVITDKDMKMLIELTKKRDISQVDNYIDNVILGNGYEPREVIERMRLYIKNTPFIASTDKPRILREIGTVDFRISQGATPEIQLKTFFAFLIMTIRSVV